MTMIDIPEDLEFSAPTAPPPDRTAVVIRDNLSRVESALSEFDKISAGLADLRKRYPADLAYDVTTTKGMAEAIAHRAAWRDPRINVEKFRKTAKAPVLALGKDIDARAAWLTEQLLEGETPIDEQIKAEERRKEEAKQARIAAEFGRVQAIQEAIAEIHMDAMKASSRASAEIQAALDAMQARELDPLVFQEMMDQAKAARDAAIGKLSIALKAKLHEEAEAARVAAERAELEQLRAAAAEQARKAAEAEAERAAVARAEEARLRAVAEAQAAELAQLRAREAARAAADEAARVAALPKPAPITPDEPDAAPAATLEEMGGERPDVQDAIGLDEVNPQPAPAKPTDTLQALAAEARASKSPAQPKMGLEWWERFYALADGGAA